MNKPQIVEHITHSVDYSVFDVKWVPNTAKFVIIGAKSTGAGILQVMEMNENNLDVVATIERNKSLKCCSFGASGIGSKNVAIGDFIGSFSVLDIEHPNTPIYHVEEAHNDIINSLDAIGGVPVDCGAPEIVTGSRDGIVKVWDIRQKECPVACMAPAAESEGGSGTRDCWTVAFGNSYSNTERAVAAGYDNGDLKMFDLRKMTVLWETNLKNGICGLEFDRKDIKMNKLCAVTLEGGFHVFDMRTFHPKKGFSSVTERDAGKSIGSNGVISGGRSTIWNIKHLPQNRDICVTCSGSGSLRLWN